MWILIVGISFLYTLSDANEVCTGTKCETSCEPLQWTSFKHCTNVNLSSNNIETIQTSSDPTDNPLEKLDLSYNKLRQLPEDFLSDATALKEINLGNNNLAQLPENFLRNSSKLQVLHLEGNLLASVPSSIIHRSLLNLSVDCTCAMATSIMQHLNKNLTDHSKLSVTCTSSSESASQIIDDFFQNNCGSQMFLALYIVLPIVALGFIVGGVSLYLWKKKNSADFEGKTTTEKSPSHGQPRYTTRNMDGVASTLNQGPRKDYENVFVGHFQTKHHEYLEEQSTPGAPSKQTMEEDIYLESDVNEGDQPIYTNTQGVYYNYHGDISASKEDDDVYILPDH